MHFKFRKVTDENGVVHIVYVNTGYALCSFDWFERILFFSDGPAVTCIACLVLEKNQ